MGWKRGEMARGECREAEGGEEEKEEVMKSQKQTKVLESSGNKKSDEVKKKGTVKRRKIQLFSTKDFKRKCLFANNDILHWIFV